MVVKTRPEPTNLLADLPSAEMEEVFTPLLNRGGCRVERIVSFGQVTPPDQAYCQDWDEQVLLLTGAARLEVDGVETVLAAGDRLLIAAGSRLSVTFHQHRCWPRTAR